MLPCKNTLLRSRTTQRPSKRTLSDQWLEPLVEREMATLICMEIDFLLRLEVLKCDINSLPNFNVRQLYKAIGDPIDQTCLRRFLIRVGH